MDERDLLTEQILAKFSQLIAAYKDYIKNQNGLKNELYKWEFIAKNQGKFNFDKDEFSEKMFKMVLGDINIIANPTRFHFKELLQNRNAEYRSIIQELYDENIDLSVRLKQFKTKTNSLLGKKSQHDERFASVLLTLKYPQKYTFYKYDDIYKSMCKFLENQGKATYHKYPHYLELISELTPIVEKDAELLELIKAKTSYIENCVLNPMLIVQDIFYQYSKNLFSIKSTTMKTNSKLNKYIELLKANYNLIFHGAPGTGKTFTAKEIASQMIFGEVIDEQKMTDEQKMQWENQCSFVQFHPSYDYTDFVEGLRPKENDGQNVGFKRKDGVFKKFCKNAILQPQTKEINVDIKSDATIWKVSLAKTGDNPIRTDCLENGYIRISWAGYGDVENFDDFDNFSDGGKAILQAFQNEMKDGDIVVSCYSSKETDAIGIIEGEYEYRKDGGEYPRFRKVKWLVKGFKENIYEINNNRAMTLSTVYKMNVDKLKIIEIIKKYAPKSEITTSQKDPFIFIIDEINRGETSKIFGELFFSIDQGYRGEEGKVRTQYQNLVDEGDIFKNGFYVPDNVYIIGTMNDIDRSVEMMDFAFRRRFAWKEIEASETQNNILDSLENKGVSCETIAEAKAKMNALNAEIANNPDLGKSYQIGAAYFKKLENYNGDFEKLWNYHLKGLLVEYLRGTGDEENKLEKFKAAYFGNVNKNETMPVS